MEDHFGGCPCVCLSVAAPFGGHLLICGPFFNNGEVQGSGMSIGGHIRISSGTPQ